MKPAVAAYHGKSQGTESARARPGATRVDALARQDLPREPRTGVVRKVSGSSSASGVVPRSESTQPHADEALASAKSRAWRCLEWGERPSQRPPPVAARVSIAQLTSAGELLRQSGPDETLPETAEFVHRVSTLIAQGLGFGRCRALCLRGPVSALSVSEAGPTKVVSVTGPVRQMVNVLRRMDLE